MKKEIVINATTDEIRVALTEDDRLAELFLEVPDKERHVGSIYLGKVERVVQGMNAAFVSIGESQDAFLHFSDVGSALDEFRDLLDERDEDDDEDDDDDETPPSPTGKGTTAPAAKSTKAPAGKSAKRPESRVDKGVLPSNGQVAGKRAPAGKRADDDKRAPAEKRSADDKRTPVDKRGQPDKRGADDKRGPADKRTPPDKRSAPDKRSPDDKRPPADKRGEPDRRSAPEKDRPADRRGAPIGDVPEGEEKELPIDAVAGSEGEETQKKKRKRGRRGGRRRNRAGRLEGESGEAEQKPEEPRSDERRDERGSRREGDRREGDRRESDRREGDRREGDRRESDRRESDRREGDRRSVEPRSVEPRGDDAPGTPSEDAPLPPAKRPAKKSAAKEKAVAKPTAGTSKTKSDPEPVKEKKKPAPRKKASARAEVKPEVEPKVAPKKKETPAAATDTEKKKPAPRKRPAKKSGGSKKGDGDIGANTIDAKLPTFQTKRSGEVTIALEKGKDVIVQVTRESYASKGVRVTTKVSLPGRFLVLLPLDPAIGISRKVQNMKERRRLRRIARSILPEGHGCIIRTVAENKDEELIRQDLTKLVETWQAIEQKVKNADPPMLLYRDQSIAATVMRDLFTPDISRVVIDHPALYNEIREYVEWAAPGMADKVEHYTGAKPIFDEYGVEQELNKLFDRKHYIPAGGYIIMDQTEAMMVIDVNSGRYAGKKDQELNSLRTNIESAREIARQIRLRDIGGLIVVDFIDLYDEKNRKKVYDELKKEMRKDRAKSVVLPMTQFGLVQMTRQRIRQQLVQTMSEPCPSCSGSGLVQSKPTIMRNLERWLQRFKEGSKEFRLTLAAHPSVIDYLTEGTVSRLTKMMLKYFIRVKVVPDESLSVGEFHFFSQRRGVDITTEYAETGKKR